MFSNLNLFSLCWYIRRIPNVFCRCTFVFVSFLKVEQTHENRVGATKPENQVTPCEITLTWQTKLNMNYNKTQVKSPNLMFHVTIHHFHKICLCEKMPKRKLEKKKSRFCCYFKQDLKSRICLGHIVVFTMISIVFLYSEWNS